MENTDSQSAGSPTETRAQDFKVEPFAEHHLQRVASFSERYWRRPRSEAFYRWRYIDSLPHSSMFVAVTEQECLGLLCALRKRFLLDGVMTPCLEIFEWHSLPGMKGSGAGIRVMRAMMKQGIRLLGIGGTPDVLRALPAMGWQEIGRAVTYELPLSGEFLETGWRERIPMRIPGERLVLRALARWYQPTQRAGPGRAMAVAQLGPEVDALYDGRTGYDFLQQPDLASLRWMTAGYGGSGSFTFWYFSVNDTLRGWVMTRLYETAQGREAAIVDFFAPSPTVELYTWMVSEASRALAGANPRVIRARVTCPIAEAALQAIRFRKGSDLPVHTFPKMAAPPATPHLTINHGDAPFRPLPDPEAATRILLE